MFAELKELLKSEIVDITCVSLVSNKEYTIPCTLKESLTNSRVNQSASDSIVCFRLDQDRWEDININSIVSYKVPN